MEYSRKIGLHRQNIIPSESTGTEELVEALSPLLNATADTEFNTFGCLRWYIAPSNASVNRYFAFAAEADADKFMAEVREAAGPINHNPEIIKREPYKKCGNVWLVAIACSTRLPPGLSMKDVQLANKINEISASYDCLATGNLPRQGWESRLVSARKRAAHSLRMQIDGVLPPPGSIRLPGGMQVPAWYRMSPTRRGP